MKNKKGFTLIELLAVIVILAIIALIAIPIILNMINNARKSASLDAAYGYIEAIEYNSGLGDIGTTGYSKLNDGIYQVSELNIKLKGKKPNYGFINVEKNKVEVASLCIDGYNVSYDGKNAEVIEACDTSEAKVLYKESKLNGAIPTLKGDMIPVTIENDGTVKKADIYSEWYKYESKNWANAVVLINKTAYKTNQTIPEDNIKAYYVWIPRYRYKLFESTTPTEIRITFEDKNTSKAKGTTIGQELTHPAFTYGTEELNGFWVGKFETSRNSSETVENAVAKIKPYMSGNSNSTITSLTSLQVSKLYEKSLSVSDNSRMMKNEEWGAVAYLSHSSFGECTDSTCNKIRINNDNRYHPGCGASSADNLGAVAACQIEYGKAVEYPQSTNGNITGIFDMSGGAWDYMMSVLADKNGNGFSGRHNVYNSGFNGKFGCPNCVNTDGTGSTALANGDSSITSLSSGINFPTNKDYSLFFNPNDTTDNRTNTNVNNGCNGDSCYGHAMGETSTGSGSKSWYGEYSNFVSYGYPWVVRGGRCTYGSSAGVFAFNYYNGRALGYISFRVVVTN